MTGQTTIAIDDRNTQAVSYTGDWIQGGTEHEHAGTVTSSTTVGDSFTVTFIGTSIAVFGRYDPSSAGVVVSYALDTPMSSNITTPSTAIEAYQQKFYESERLQQKKHTLTVTMVKVNKIPSNSNGDQGGTVWFDYFDVQGTPASAPQEVGSSGNGNSKSPSETESSKGSKGASQKLVGAIVGGVIGGIAFLVLAILLGWILYRRLKRRRPRYYGTYGTAVNARGAYARETPPVLPYGLSMSTAAKSSSASIYHSATSSPSPGLPERSIEKLPLPTALYSPTFTVLPVHPTTNIEPSSGTIAGAVTSGTVGDARDDPSQGTQNHTNSCPTQDPSGVGECGLL
ncbi:hypothetical protein D9758_009120 [Tetrapyrgos nigripes]|uniref:Uncharacterized protein n=1 Tax=Tetrapyrgos nigripes TaxID=182062 RepID=A0A8H5G8J2_9AGAR|nr:hypothetical protein D9758_009120 [Tetrapyrgos nigripes]